ncbi:aspartyl-phosphate phosphatase Spo0E family protein [Paenibacillus sp. S150]|uniref:aspartyl-phosphate phosphatase Spo0E family protein n=1 Tax=Paenibacillus sp. S150 TaxID=2749826 RepID=UPI001C566420|nr:aspartyl-phosphate phosphatase Spo0E family protein [Paenibacillus sp. S150]MBW4085396.1 aspartyl-phosphate phosphatase Spo0E family protein [Paenibacillus sp. S150]
MQNNENMTLLQVESAREQLYQTQKKYGFLTHPKVIEQSVALDHLLNQYSSQKTVC